MKHFIRYTLHRRIRNTTDPFFRKEGQEKLVQDTPKPFFDLSNNIQTKLTVGNPHDPLEQQADKVANQVANQRNGIAWYEAV